MLKSAGYYNSDNFDGLDSQKLTLEYSSANNPARARQSPPHQHPRKNKS